MEAFLGILLALAIVGLVVLWISRRKLISSTVGSVERLREEALEERDEALGKLRKDLEQVIKVKLEEVEKKRTQGLARQAGIIWGQAAERLTPLFGEWRLRYNPADLVLVNNTVDYLVLVGRSEGVITEVVFQEVKSGGAGLVPKKGRLSTAKRGIQDYLRECVEDGKVRWETWRFNSTSGELLLDLPASLGSKVKNKGLEKVFKQVEEAKKQGKDIEFLDKNPD